jgi:hypothetical protein
MWSAAVINIILGDTLRVLQEANCVEQKRSTLYRILG